MLYSYGILIPIIVVSAVNISSLLAFEKWQIAPDILLEWQFDWRILVRAISLAVLEQLLYALFFCEQEEYSLIWYALLNSGFWQNNTSSTLSTSGKTVHFNAAYLFLEKRKLFWESLQSEKCELEVD